MEKLRLAFFSLALLLAASLALSCGASSMSNQTGKLESITISPASAAPPASSAEVQFTATGHYNTYPYTVTPQPAIWGACFAGAATTDVTVTNTGLAQCGQVGGGPKSTTYAVYAYDMTNCNLLAACGGGCTVVGTAQLTCPTNEQ